MKTKKFLSFLLSAGIAVSSFYAAPLIPGVDDLPLVSSITAAAGDGVLSGWTSDISYQYDANSTLYFTQDAADNHLEVCGCFMKKTGSFIELPSSLNLNGVDYPVTAIAHHAFQNQTNLYEIIIGSLSVGGAAFYDCTNLVMVYGYPDYIGDSAFHGCSALERNVGEYASHIGSHAFLDCSSIRRIILQNTEYIGTAAFYGCNGADLIDLSATSLTTIPDFGFHQCTNTRSIKLPETVTSIGTMAFDNCDSVKQVYIPDSVTNIAHGAFYDCDNLKTVMMSENISTLGDYAFYNCPSMKFFVCKNRNASVGYYALGWSLTENMMPYKNPDFVLWSTGAGSVKNYASSMGLTFKKISNAASLASSRYVDYEWSKSNTIVAWSSGDRHYFNDQHLPYANGHAGTVNGGICSGLSAVSALTSSGYLSVSDYAPGYSKLRDIKGDMYHMPLDVVSYVTTVFSNIDRSQFDYRTYSWDCTATNGSHMLSKEMLRYAEYITYGADAAMLIVGNYQNTEIPHGVVCFGMEYKANASDKNDSVWNGWDARLLIYNVNKTTHSKEDYVYVNLSDGSWKTSMNTDANGVTANCDLYMKYSYDTMVNTSKYNMTADEFFAAIRN